MVSEVRCHLSGSFKVGDEPEEQDYEWMKRVTECGSGRQVQSVLLAYNQPHFSDLVHFKQEQAKKIVAIEDCLRSRGCVLV